MGPSAIKKRLTKRAQMKGVSQGRQRKLKINYQGGSEKIATPYYYFYKAKLVLCQAWIDG